MSDLIEAMIKHIHHIVYEEHRSFSYIDFIKFEVDGKEYKIAHGTFRNNVSSLMKEGLVEVSYKSNITFYTLRGIKFDKASRFAMTGDHTGVAHSPISVSTPPPSVTSLSSNPLYRILKELPLDKSTVHDIRLRFNSPQIYKIVFSGISRKSLGYEGTINSRSKDILLPAWKIRDLLVKATIHRTDTVSIMIGCSLNPISFDFKGIIRLTNVLSIVEERISRLVEGFRKAHGFGVIAANIDLDNSFPSRRIYHNIIPSFSEWTVTMWHFGADASIEYSGERFSVTWETAENVLIRAYSKVMNDNKIRIRLERQEYPKATLADIIEEKLSSDRKYA
ncbi:MAG: hypothetical protein ACRD8Z_18150 [Nitrososphaeraceae archaeon]